MRLCDTLPHPHVIIKQNKGEEQPCSQSEDGSKSLWQLSMFIKTKVKKILLSGRLFISRSKSDEISVKCASALPTFVAITVLISKVIMVVNC